MELYGLDLPELVPENAELIIETCQAIHQGYYDKRKRNTKAQKWDKYWIDAYNIVLEALNTGL